MSKLTLSSNSFVPNVKAAPFVPPSAQKQPQQKQERNPLFIPPGAAQPQQEQQKQQEQQPQQEQQRPPPTPGQPFVHPGRALAHQQANSMVHPARQQQQQQQQQDRFQSYSTPMKQHNEFIPSSFKTPHNNQYNHYNNNHHQQHQQPFTTPSNHMYTVNANFIPTPYQPQPFQPLPLQKQEIPTLIDRATRTGPPIKHTFAAMLAIRDDDESCYEPESIPLYLLHDTQEYDDVFEWSEMLLATQSSHKKQQKDRYLQVNNGTSGGGGGGRGRNRMTREERKAAQAAEQLEIKAERANRYARIAQMAKLGGKNQSHHDVSLQVDLKKGIKGTVSALLPLHQSTTKKWVVKINPDEVGDIENTNNNDRFGSRYSKTPGRMGQQPVPALFSQVVDVNEATLRNVTIALNKLTTSNYSLISKKLRIQLAKVTDLTVLQGIARVFFEAAITNKQQAFLYSRLLRFLTTPAKILIKNRQELLSTHGNDMPRMKKNEHMAFIREMQGLPDIPTFNPATKQVNTNFNPNIQSTTVITLLLSSCYLQLAGELPPLTSSASLNKNNDDDEEGGNSSNNEDNDKKNQDNLDNETKSALALLDDPTLTPEQQKIQRLALRKKRAEGTINLLAELFRYYLIPSPVVLLCAHMLLGTAIHTDQQQNQQQLSMQTPTTQPKSQQQQPTTSTTPNTLATIPVPHLNEEDIYMCCSLLEKAGKMLDFLTESFLEQQEVGKRTISLRRQAKVLALADKTLQNGAATLGEHGDKSQLDGKNGQKADKNKDKMQLSVKKLNQDAHVVNNVLSMPEIKYSPELHARSGSSTSMHLNQINIQDGNDNNNNNDNNDTNTIASKITTHSINQIDSTSKHNPASVLSALSLHNDTTVKPHGSPTALPVLTQTYSPIQLQPLQSLSPLHNNTTIQYSPTATSNLLSLPNLSPTLNNSSLQQHPPLQILDAGSASPPFMFQISLQDLEPSFSPTFVSIPVPSHAFQQLPDLNTLASPMKSLNLTNSANGNNILTTPAKDNNNNNQQEFSLSSLLTPSVINNKVDNSNTTTTSTLPRLGDPLIDLNNTNTNMSVLPSYSPLLRASHLRSQFTEHIELPSLPPLDGSVKLNIDNKSTSQPSSTTIPTQQPDASVQLSALSMTSPQAGAGSIPMRGIFMLSPLLTGHTGTDGLDLSPLAAPLPAPFNTIGGGVDPATGLNELPPLSALGGGPGLFGTSNLIQNNNTGPSSIMANNNTTKKTKKDKLVLKQNTLITPRTLQQFKASVDLLFEQLNKIHAKAKIAYDELNKLYQEQGIESGDLVTLPSVLPDGYISKRIFYKIEDLLTLRKNKWDLNPPKPTTQQQQQQQQQGKATTARVSKFLSKSAKDAIEKQERTQQQQQQQQSITTVSAQVVVSNDKNAKNEPPQSTAKSKGKNKNKENEKKGKTSANNNKNDNKTTASTTDTAPLVVTNNEDDLAYLRELIMSTPIILQASPVLPPPVNPELPPYKTQQCTFFSHLLGVDSVVIKLVSEMTSRMPTLPVPTDLIRLLSELFLQSPFLPFVHATPHNTTKCFHCNQSNITSSLGDNNNNQRNGNDVVPDDDLHFDLDVDSLFSTPQVPPQQPCYHYSFHPAMVPSSSSQVKIIEKGITTTTATTTTTAVVATTDTPRADSASVKKTPTKTLNIVNITSKTPQVALQLANKWWKLQLIEITLQLLQWLLVNYATNPTKQSVSLELLQMFFTLILSSNLIETVTATINTDIIPHTPYLSLDFDRIHINSLQQQGFLLDQNDVLTLVKRFAVMYNGIKEDSPRCMNVIGQILQFIAQTLHQNSIKPKKKSHDKKKSHTPAETVPNQIQPEDSIIETTHAAPEGQPEVQSETKEPLADEAKDKQDTDINTNTDTNSATVLVIAEEDNVTTIPTTDANIVQTESTSTVIDVVDTEPKPSLTSVIVDTLTSICPDVGPEQDPDKDFVIIEDNYVAVVEAQIEQSITNFNNSIDSLVQLLPPMNAAANFNGHSGNSLLYNTMAGAKAPKNKNKAISPITFTPEQLQQFFTACSTLLDPTSTIVLPNETKKKLIPWFHTTFNQIVIADDYTPQHLTEEQLNEIMFEPEFTVQQLQPIDSYFITSGYFSIKSFLTDIQAWDEAQ